MEALDLLISWGAQISLVVDVTEQHNASVAVSQRATGRPASTCIDWGLHDSLDAETLSVLRVGGVGEKASRDKYYGMYGIPTRYWDLLVETSKNGHAGALTRLLEVCSDVDKKTM